MENDQLHDTIGDECYVLNVIGLTKSVISYDQSCYNDIGNSVIEDGTMDPTLIICISNSCYCDYLYYIVIFNNIFSFLCSLINLYNLLETPCCQFYYYMKLLNLVVDGKVKDYMIPSFKRLIAS